MAATGGRAKAAAAAGELAGEPKRIEWEGITFDCPPQLPGELFFDFADLEDESSGKSLTTMRTVLRRLTGEEGERAIRTRIAERGLSLDEVSAEIGALLEQVMNAYGSAVGESPQPGGSSSAPGTPRKQISNGSTGSS